MNETGSDLRNPLITIIVAVLNGARTLQRCIDSVANQIYPYKEFIIIDGESIDNTVDILQANDHDITYWESKPDKGIYHAWNKALEYAKGEWICFLGADDFFWDSHVLNNIKTHLISAAKVNIRYVYGKQAIISPNSGKVLFIEGRPWNHIKKRFKEINTITHSGTFHHKDLFKIYGRFNQSFEIAGDYDFLLRELKYNEAYFASDLIIIGMTLGGLGTQFDKKFQTAIEFLRARKNNNIQGMPWLIYRWLIKIGIFNTLRYLLGDKMVERVDELYRIAVRKIRLN